MSSSTRWPGARSRTGMLGVPQRAAPRRRPRMSAPPARPAPRGARRVADATRLAPHGAGPSSRPRDSAAPRPPSIPGRRISARGWCWNARSCPPSRARPGTSAMSAAWSRCSRVARGSGRGARRGAGRTRERCDDRSASSASGASRGAMVIGLWASERHGRIVPLPGRRRGATDADDGVRRGDLGTSPARSRLVHLEASLPLLEVGAAASDRRIRHDRAFRTVTVMRRHGGRG